MILTLADTEQEIPASMADLRLLYCDFCHCSEVEDCMSGPGNPGGELRPMWVLSDGCRICRNCLDAGQPEE